MKTTGLTIIEAIQSGLPFKRELDEFYHTNNERIKYTFTHTALLAQDWQIKLPEVTITRENLAEAIRSADKEITYTSESYIQQVAEKLGL